MPSVRYGSSRNWLLALACVSILWGQPDCALADETRRARRIHDSSNRVIGTIERQSDGSERVYDRSGRYLGSADEYGTRDATGRTVSPDRAPEILLPHGDVQGAEGRDDTTN